MIDQLKSIRLNKLENYDFQNYVDEKDIVYNIRLPDENGQIKSYPMNFWKHEKFKVSTKIIIELKSSVRLNIPLKIFIKNLQYKSDLHLIETLSILYNFKPEIEYDYYNVGEKFSNKRYGVTTSPNSIIKNFNIYRKGEILTLEDYIQKIRKKLDPIQLNEFVKNFLNEPKNLILKENYNLNEIDQNDLDEKYEIERFNNNPYYNDQLDMDQQDPEFWDNL